MKWLQRLDGALLGAADAIVMAAWNSLGVTRLNLMRFLLLVMITEALAEHAVADRPLYRRMVTVAIYGVIWAVEEITGRLGTARLRNAIRSSRAATWRVTLRLMFGLFSAACFVLLSIAGQWLNATGWLLAFAYVIVSSSFEPEEPRKRRRRQTRAVLSIA